MSDFRPKNKVIRIILIILAILAFVAGFSYLYITQKYNQKIYNLLDTYKLIPKDETFTELYLDKYPRFYAEEVFDGKKAAFSFVVHNLEGKDVKYKYRVYFDSVNGQTRVIDSGMITLKQNESKTKDEYYVFYNSHDFGNIVVSLPELNQEVFFSIPVKNRI